MRAAGALLAVVLLLAGVDAAAQWETVHDPRISRTADGEPDLSAPAPRAPDGRPDLSGVWLPDSDLELEVTIENMPLPRHFVSITAGMEPEDVPFQPWARELFEQRLKNQGTDSPLAHCKPSGVPILIAVPLPHKIVQSPDLVLVLYEENTVFRQIFLDGRKPVADPVPRWMGYSWGRWDADTLVVESIGFTEQSWLDGAGHPHSEQLRVIERYRRPDVGHLDVEVTIEDPGAYTQPITYTVSSTLLPDEDLLEYFCSENEKSAEHYE